MSEYQYFEFRAIDRSLTETEMRKLRSYSTRAEITPTCFKNEYHWRDFKGDENQWMERYFDAFLYFANWGTRIIQLRLPSSVLDPEIVRQYCPGDSASIRVKGDKTIISLACDNEGGCDWSDDGYNLASIIGSRAELVSHDYRALYLSWLLCVQYDDIESTCVEPPIPPGLNHLSTSLKNLSTFLQLDQDLLCVAAQASPPLKIIKPNEKKVLSWISNIAEAEKNEILTKLVLGKNYDLSAGLLQRYINEHGSDEWQIKAPVKRRTVGELLQAAEKLAANGSMKKNVANES